MRKRKAVETESTEQPEPTTVLVGDLQGEITLAIQLEVGDRDWEKYLE